MFLGYRNEFPNVFMNFCVQNKDYSLGELQSMFWEMAQDFEFPEWSRFPQQQVYDSSQWFCAQEKLDDSRTSKRARWDTNRVAGRSSISQAPGLEMHKASEFCR